MAPSEEFFQKGAVVIMIVKLTCIKDCEKQREEAYAIFGHTATYSCNTGYILMGSNTRTCQATRKWSDSAPTCQGMLLLKLE